MNQTHRGGYRILCGVDFSPASEQAIREAYGLAARVGQAELHFVHALHETPPSQNAGEADGTLECALARLEAYVRRVLLCKSIDAPGFTGVFHVRVESPVPALIGVATQEGVDVIMVGANERSGLSQLWHRSALHSLIKGAPAPVLVAHPRRRSEREPLPSDRTGVFAAVTRSSEAPPPPTTAMDADSTSSLCRMHELRATRPSDISGLIGKAPSPSRRLDTAS